MGAEPYQPKQPQPEASSKSSPDQPPRLQPMFLEPLDEPMQSAVDESAQELLKVNWKTEKEGWICCRLVPDTGAEICCTPEEMAEGYEIEETKASKEGKNFLSASDHEIPNLGEVTVPMRTAEGHWTARTWQVGKGLTRPLMSVAQECDNGNVFMFGRSGGAIFSLTGGPVRRFSRVGGTYEHEVWIPPAKAIKRLMQTGFAGQGS